MKVSEERNKNMARIYVVGNGKGGVGKTETVVAIANEGVEQGKRVLVVDMDQSANASYRLLGKRDLPKDRKTIFDVIVDKIDPREAIVTVNDEWGSVHLIPSNDELGKTSQHLSTVINYHHRLREALSHKEIQKHYDWIVVDTGPTRSINTLIAFFAADYIILPTDFSDDSLDGINMCFSQVINYLRSADFKIDDSNIKIIGCRSQKEHSKDFKQAIEDIKEAYGSMFLEEHRIPDRVIVRACAREKPPIPLKNKVGSDHPILSNYKKIIDIIMEESVNGR